MVASSTPSKSRKPGFRWNRGTVAALRRGGVLVLDDMDLTRHDDEQLRSALAVVRHRLLDNAELVSAELGFRSGVIVAVKRRS
jgi:hypothetical protein